jgi:hypothetical protein
VVRFRISAVALNVSESGVTVNVATTTLAVFIVSEHVLDAVESQPLHDVNEYPAFGVAVRVNDTPLVSSAEHVLEQVNAEPPMVPLTVPPFVGATVTLNELLGENVAETIAPWFITIEQAPVPVQSPPQPVNTYPDAGVATGVAVAPGV